MSAHNGSSRESCPLPVTGRAGLLLVGEWWLDLESSRVARSGAVRSVQELEQAAAGGQSMSPLATFDVLPGETAIVQAHP